MHQQFRHSLEKTSAYKNRRYLDGFYPQINEFYIISLVRMCSQYSQLIKDLSRWEGKTLEWHEVDNHNVYNSSTSFSSVCLLKITSYSTCHWQQQHGNNMDFNFSFILNNDNTRFHNKDIWIYCQNYLLGKNRRAFFFKAIIFKWIEMQTGFPPVVLARTQPVWPDEKLRYRAG